MLSEILGSQTAEKIFLHLHHYGETYASAIARDFEISVGQVQRQLDRYENTGILISRKLGKTRVYIYNLKHPLTRPFQELVKRVYDSIPQQEKTALFMVRRRPRAKNKPILGRESPV